MVSHKYVQSVINYIIVQLLQIVKDEAQVTVLWAQAMSQEIAPEASHREGPNVTLLDWLMSQPLLKPGWEKMLETLNWGQ